MSTPFAVATIFFSFAGLYVSAFIAHAKKRKEPLVCPLRAHCQAVIHSAHAKFLGIKVEALGIAYYACITLAYGVLLIVPELYRPEAAFLLLCLHATAFLFSVYLVSLQAFVIRNWCFWCLVSASISTAIFALALLHLPYPLGPLVAEFRYPFLLMHLVGVAIGVGGATFSDLFFFRFLKDLRISTDETETLRVFSHMIWLALGVLYVSGFGLYLGNMEVLNASPKFLLKLIVVAVITVNGFLLHFLVTPNLTRIAFGQAHDHAAGELRRLRRIAFALGSVSFTSWYTALALGAMRTSPASFGVLLAVYIALLVGAVSTSQVLEWRFAKKPVSDA